MFALKFLVVFGLLCMVETNNVSDSCEAKLSFPSFAGQHSFISNLGDIGFGIGQLVDQIFNALVGPRGWSTSCTSSLYCRVSGNGDCCCSAFTHPLCVASADECVNWIGGVEYGGYCIGPE